jgi:multidrug efflux pump subunit AcrB
VQQSGVTVEKSQSSFLLIMRCDKTNTATSSDIADWLVSNMQDPLARVEASAAQVFGAEYAMRIWMDPTKLASYSLMPSDVQSRLKRRTCRFPPVKSARCLVQRPAADRHRARQSRCKRSISSKTSS